MPKKDRKLLENWEYPDATSSNVAPNKLINTERGEERDERDAVIVMPDTPPLPAMDDPFLRQRPWQSPLTYLSELAKTIVSWDFYNECVEGVEKDSVVTPHSDASFLYLEALGGRKMDREPVSRIQEAAAHLTNNYNPQQDNADNLSQLQEETTFEDNGDSTFKDDDQKEPRTPGCWPKDKWD